MKRQNLILKNTLSLFLVGLILFLVFLFFKDSPYIYTVFFSLLVIFVSYYYYTQNKRINRPIAEMTEAVFQYSENNFKPEITVKSNDEVGNLGMAITKMGKALEASTIMNRKERDLLDHVLDSMAVGVVYYDKDGTVFNLNLTGKHYYSMYMQEAGRLLDRYLEGIYESLKTGTGKRMEVQQSQMIFDLRFSPLLAKEDSDVQGVLILIEEITNTKRLEGIQEELITNVSHDLRTPLSTIMGYSEAILDDIAETVEDKNEMAKIIHDEASELNTMINNLLDVSRMKAGYTEMNFSMVAVKPFMSRILARLSDRFYRENIRCMLTIEEDIEYCQMDEEKMHNTLYNLLDNAIRYSAEPNTREERYVHIEVKLDKILDEIIFIISDNGIGISEESIPYVFERFFKDDKARTRPKTNGSGIGLSLVYNIVKKHSGQVEVESVQDEGTVFIVRLPYLETTYEETEEIL